MSEEPKTEVKKEAKKIVAVDGKVTITVQDDKKHFKQSNESY